MGYVLASTNLDAEQKLQVALARRQCWVRAFQLGPILGLLSYSTCVLVEATGLVKLPRGSRTGVRTAVPLGFCALGMTLGAYLGGCEGKPMMNAALRERERSRACMPTCPIE